MSLIDELKRYRCIVTDPPWPENGGGKSKRGADRHYQTMSVRDIVALHQMHLGVQLLGSVLNPNSLIDEERGCHLWVWATSNYLPSALTLINHLGFRYIRDAVWVKVAKNKLQIGLGQYLRGAHELLLMGSRGPASVPEPHNIPSVILAERTRHSRKPDASYKMIETVSPGPRLEMFSTQTRDGWDRHGDGRWAA